MASARRPWPVRARPASTPRWTVTAVPTRRPRPRFGSGSSAHKPRGPRRAISGVLREHRVSAPTGSAGESADPAARRGSVQPPPGLHDHHAVGAGVHPALRPHDGAVRGDGLLVHPGLRGHGVLGLFWLDRFDRKRTLLANYAGFILSTLACGAATGYVSMLVARSLAGACAGLMGAVIMAIIADVVPPERRGRAIGTVMSTIGLSAVAGVPLGLALANLLGWRAPFWAICALAGMLWLGLLKVLPRLDQHLSRSAEETRANPLSMLAAPGLALGWLLTFSVAFASFLLIPYLGTYMVGNLGLAQTDLPWVYLAGGAGTLVSAKLVGRFTDRLGPGRMLALLLVGTVGPHLLFTHLSPSPLPVVMGAFVMFMALTSTRAIPTIALVTARVPPTLRGRFLAVNMAASDGASALSAWVSGLLIATSPEGALIGFGQVGW